MNYLEVISVRIAREQDFDEALQICTEASLSRETGRFMGLKTYRSEGYESDIIIHIHWNGDSPVLKKSLLGMQLARGLSSFGIVSHNLLVETGSSNLRNSWDEAPGMKLT